MFYNNYSELLIKKFIYIVLTLVIIISIYYLSSMNNKETNSLSKGIVYKSIELVEHITHKEYDKRSIVNKLNYPIRKCAHFTIFLLLGISIFLFINTFNINIKILISILICIVFAILDETHQMFSLGRSSSILDILIDSMGSIVGIMIISKRLKVIDKTKKQL